MISASKVTIEIGSRVLLQQGTFQVPAGEKAGLVGRNGTGKSTLVSALVGASAPAVRVHGTVSIKGVCGYLPQVPHPDGLGIEPTGFSHVLSGRGLDVLDDELTEARKAMSDDPSSKNISRFSELEESFRESGGYDAEATVARLADGLGLRQDLLLDEINGLSGGQRRRVDLVRVLFQQPEVMILDEPTNHLDRAAKRWLAEELGKFAGAMLVISHDLDLLDSSITMILSLENKALTEYKTNYTGFLTKSAEEEVRAADLASRQHKEIVRLETLADSMRGSTARRARVAKSLDKRVERLQSDKTELKKKQKAARFTLPTPLRSGDTPLSLSNIGVTYGRRRILQDVRFVLGRGERLAVIGKNGAGKSSLLRCIAGVQEPTTGTVEFGYNTFVGYFAQEHEQVDRDISALENIDDEYLKTLTERRSLLGSFGLHGALAEQPASTLSGGERAKLGLAMLAAGTSNLLILDEPNNNLDPSSVVAVGDMLARWSGTMVVVSHDADFVEALQPTHSLHLPQERFDFWREEYLDEVESR